MEKQNEKGYTFREWFRSATAALGPGMGRPSKETLAAMKQDWKNNVHPSFWNQAYERLAQEM